MKNKRLLSLLLILALTSCEDADSIDLVELYSKYVLFTDNTYSEIQSFASSSFIGEEAGMLSLDSYCIIEATFTNSASNYLINGLSFDYYADHNYEFEFTFAFCSSLPESLDLDHVDEIEYVFKSDDVSLSFTNKSKALEIEFTIDDSVDLSNCYLCLLFTNKSFLNEGDNYKISIGNLSIWNEEREENNYEEDY